MNILNRPQEGPHLLDIGRPGIGNLFDTRVRQPVETHTVGGMGDYGQVISKKK